jgi:hypothetical protein
MKKAAHIKMTNKRFLRLKRRQIREAMDLMRNNKGIDGSLVTGSAYLPREVYLRVVKAYNELYFAYKLLIGI